MGRVELPSAFRPHGVERAKRIAVFTFRSFAAPPLPMSVRWRRPFTSARPSTTLHMPTTVLMPLRNSLVLLTARWTLKMGGKMGVLLTASDGGELLGNAVYARKKP